MSGMFNCNNKEMKTTITEEPDFNVHFYNYDKKQWDKMSKDEFEKQNKDSSVILETREQVYDKLLPLLQKSLPLPIIDIIGQHLCCKRIEFNNWPLKSYFIKVARDYKLCRGKDVDFLVYQGSWSTKTTESPVKVCTAYIDDNDEIHNCDSDFPNIIMNENGEETIENVKDVYMGTFSNIIGPLMFEYEATIICTLNNGKCLAAKSAYPYYNVMIAKDLNILYERVLFNWEKRILREQPENILEIEVDEEIDNIRCHESLPPFEDD